MIRLCTPNDFDAIYTVINAAAEAYRGVIPADRWHEPYMPREELRSEIEAGVVFWGYEDSDKLVGVMGIQDVTPQTAEGVTLIRHAYVHPDWQRQGIGGALLDHLREEAASASRPLLVGTWAAATWAIRFYEEHGFLLATPDQKDRLLRLYWSIPARQIETSVVLVDETREPPH